MDGAQIYSLDCEELTTWYGIDHTLNLSNETRRTMENTPYRRILD